MNRRGMPLPSWRFQTSLEEETEQWKNWEQRCPGSTSQGCSVWSRGSGKAHHQEVTLKVRPPPQVTVEWARQRKKRIFQAEGRAELGLGLRELSPAGWRNSKRGQWQRERERQREKRRILRNSPGQAGEDPEGMLSQ